MDRRRFLTLGLAGAGTLVSRPPRASDAGRVVVARDLVPAGAALRSNRDALPEGRVRERLEDAMEGLLGPEPWRRLFDPEDIVAIKINGLASGHLSPRPELAWAVVDGLRSAGVEDGHIILWDRTTRELERSGFARQTGADRVRIYGTDSLRGGGYGGDFESVGAVGSLVTQIIGRYATALVNLGVLKDHDLAGISAGMKNLYGAIHNPNRYHDHACDPYVAQVAALPSIRRTLRLTVIDAVLAQAEGGPAFTPEWIWPCGRILVATDPVACDQIAWDLVEGERARRGLPSLEEAGRAPAWIATAQTMGLGRAAPLEVEEV